MTETARQRDGHGRVVPGGRGGQHTNGPLSMLDRVAIILDVFDLTEELNLSQVAGRTGLPRSSVHRLLQQMVALQWIERVDFGYRLGIRMRELGHHALMQDRIQRAALPHLYPLRDLTGHSVHLSVLVDSDSVAVETIWGRDVAPSISALRHASNATASGKVLLAARGYVADDLCWPLPRLTSATTTTAHQLAAELARVRRSGVATSYEEFAVGTVSVAVPVGPLDGATTALAVSGRAGTVQAHAVTRVLRDAAARIWADSHRLARAGTGSDQSSRRVDQLRRAR